MMNTIKKESPTMKLVSNIPRFALAITALLVIQASGSSDTATAGHRTLMTATETVAPVNVLPPVSTDTRNEREGQATVFVATTDSQSTAMQQAATYAAATTMGPPELTDRALHAENRDQPSQDSSPVAPRDKMSGPVAALLNAGATGNADLVVRYDQHPELFDDELVAKLGGTVTRSYAHLDMRAIQLPVAALENLASDINVDWLSIDDEVSNTSSASRAAANLPASGSANAGYRGLNVGVAVLDTGASVHADLSDNILQYSFLNGAYPTPEIVNGNIVNWNDSARYDGYGHGTHVAGLLSGTGEDSLGEYKGSATDSKVLALQVLNANGGGSMSDVMAALDWLLTYGDYFDIRVVNLSLGKGISESNETDPLVLAVEELWDAGMVVVVAAGNDGYSGSMTINSPGNSRKVITVGSLTDNGTGSDFVDDYVSSFSSQGPTIGDYVLKPDLLAPGNRVVAAVANDSKLSLALPTRRKACKTLLCGNDVYLEMSGTSMATPIVSAAVALMLEKDPSLSPATVKARLMRSARKIDADPTQAGAGLLDTNAALNDSGVVVGDALSPLMIIDVLNGGVLVEDTAVLWGDALWGSAYLFSNAANWSNGATFTGAGGVTANGYMWTDGSMAAKGYQWTDGGVGAKGYQWTDGVGAKSLLDGDAGTEFFLNDDAPGQ